MTYPSTIRLGGMVDLNYLSHDPMVKRDYLSDELVHKKPHSHLLLELVKASKYVFNGPLNFKCSVGCSVGSEDTVVDFQAVKRFFEKLRQRRILILFKVPIMKRILKLKNIVGPILIGSEVIYKLKVFKSISAIFHTLT